MAERGSLVRRESLQPSEFQGIFIPTVTPFKKMGNQTHLDLPSHIRHIRYLADPLSQASGLFLGSNAGQGRDMSLGILKLSISTGIETVRKTNHDLPVVVGALRSSLSEVIEVVEFAEISGADAIVIAPGLTKGVASDILKIISEITDLPIIIYNNPGFQERRDLPLEFLKEAAENPKVIGIKDTSGKEEYFQEVLNIFHARGKKVMQGDTKAGLKRSILDADGMVPVEANLYPRILAEIFDRSHNYQYPNDLEKVLQLIGQAKGDFGGTTGYIIHRLCEEGIFESEQTYPKEN
ncbi:MAG: Dihydrodipicolinate synthase [Candidatus Roizmanbacteria bacterium GW2011_GWC2_37_13]|uniref:Dihydrodipicolinate synthase n=1 Tax=Candidatus Roizmanbacteria bacterium GW2011_GWC2_37_13 TaxID=1618486 RepID=A0A0G0IR13_9BACT|nr:MAG: Dihydrodipicolinate synthetase [Candidatus Roizmanbacteria bacterium GW2011_GWC1_37_12]KKQ26589.1 MAG: Dihydrodipicolinate synthase [Candidatus Roizmanbacteria bacterium GW2011_GWC2_37_13]